MENFVAQYVPLIGSAVGWIAAAVIIFRMLANGTLHTDREFQDRVNEAARIEKFYAAEKAEDKETLKSFLESLQRQSKALEKRASVDSVVTNVMGAVQKQATLRDQGEAIGDNHAENH